MTAAPDNTEDLMTGTGATPPADPAAITTATDIIVGASTTVANALGAYRHLPAVQGLSINHDNHDIGCSPTVYLCPGRSFSLHAAYNVAVWAEALGTSLVFICKGVAAGELYTTTVMDGLTVRVRTLIYQGHTAELVDRLHTHSDHPAIADSDVRLSPTPAQVVAALKDHPDVADQP